MPEGTTLFTYLKKLFTRKPEQRTRCWCPKCKNELISSGSYVKHFLDMTVHYRCVKCGTETQWDFDCPAPILLETKGADGEWRSIPSEEWECDWLHCDRGLGLAGRDSCPGDPRDKDCPEFTTEFSDYTGDDDLTQTGGAS